MKRSIMFLLVVCVLASACGDKLETPQEGLEAIASLYEKRDFDQLVRTRYAEIDKTANDAQIQELVERLAERFASEEQLSAAIATYRKAFLLEPELSENDTVAHFKLESGFIKLSRMKSGNWGFHL